MDRYKTKIESESWKKDAFCLTKIPLRGGSLSELEQLHRYRLKISLQNEGAIYFHFLGSP